jgi:hypothetical protein
MNEYDDHVIPYDEAVRRHRAREEARKRTDNHEVKISDAMSHLLEGEMAESQADEGPTPAHLRHIVEREFADKEDRDLHLVGEGRSGREPDERQPEVGDEPEGAICTLDRRPDQPRNE